MELLMGVMIKQTTTNTRTHSLSGLILSGFILSGLPCQMGNDVSLMGCVGSMVIFPAH
jgi:hypothetical protein